MSLSDFEHASKSDAATNFDQNIDLNLTRFDQFFLLVCVGTMW